MTATPTPAPTARATALYLYAVCRPGTDRPATDLPGTDLPGTALPADSFTDVTGHPGGGPVRTLAVGPLTAVVQDVPAAEYTEQALHERLSDRVGLERCARTHHDVVAHAAGRADTLPLPLATLYLGEDGLRDALRRDAARFRAALDRIAGREEWGVKVYAAPPGTSPAPAAPRPQDGVAGDPAAGSGRAYLDRLRDRSRVRQERADDVVRLAQRVESALRGTAVAVRRLRTHGAETTGRDRTQVLNAACLLPRGREASLARTVTRLRTTEDVHIEVTGPWVPYSFVDGDTLDGAALGGEAVGGEAVSGDAE